MGEMTKREESDKSSVMLLGDFNFTWDSRSRALAKELSGEPLSRVVSVTSVTLVEGDLP